MRCRIICLCFFFILQLPGDADPRISIETNNSLSSPGGVHWSVNVKVSHPVKTLHVVMTLFTRGKSGDFDQQQIFDSLDVSPDQQKREFRLDLYYSLVESGIFYEMGSASSVHKTVQTIPLPPKYCNILPYPKSQDAGGYMLWIGSETVDRPDISNASQYLLLKVTDEEAANMPNH